MTKLSPHPLAQAQWQGETGVQQLLALWERSDEKADAEMLTGQLAAALNPEPATIVELGCGSGRLIPHLPFQKYLGIDNSPGLLAVAKEKYGGKGVSFRQADFTAKVLRKNSDIVICVHVARHYPDPLALLDAALAWPAQSGHVLSVLFGPEQHELLNGVAVAIADLNAWMERLDVAEYADRPAPFGLTTRYMAIKASAE